MDKNKIFLAINSAIYLLNNEVQNIELKELQEEYIAVIEDLENALLEINKND